MRRKGLYPVIVGVLIVLLLLSKIFETQINTASPFLQGVLLGVTILIVLGAIVLALWDTKVIGKKEVKGDKRV